MLRNGEHPMFPGGPMCSEMGVPGASVGALPAASPCWPISVGPLPRKASSAEPCPAHLVGISASSRRCVHTEPHLLLAEIGFGVGLTYPGNEQLMGRQKPACFST